MDEKTHLTTDCLPTRTLLIALDTGEYDTQISLDELTELAETAGATVCATLVQKRDTPDPATCIGSGRLAEAALIVKNLQLELVVFDRELSGSQLYQIEKATDCRVIDRTMLILDIFAQRARSAEGRLQVELAQQRYLLPRLLGRGNDLSRLGGGIGTRGPGETKLETDRRSIRRRVTALERRLEEVRQRRDLQSERRKKDDVTTVAIVGYTNVGKSTLLNTLTEAGVLAQDMLFCTLDPTARALTLPNGRVVMLIDTVGLVRRLPHPLVEAFRSTLEAATSADLVLNVCDISSPEAAAQIEVARQLLSDLGGAQIPTLNVLNKCDLIRDLPLTMDADTCLISAKSGFGLPDLLERIAQTLSPSHTRATLLLPYTEGALTGELRARGTVYAEDFLPDGLRLDLMIDNRLLSRCTPFLVRE